MDFYLLFFGVMLMEVVRYCWNADDTDETQISIFFDVEIIFKDGL